MRHKSSNVKFGRSKSHREALVSMLVGGLVKRKSIRTTVVKAKVAAPVAEKLVTLARKGDLAARRRVAAFLGDEAIAKELFDKIVPMMEGRHGGYTRIVKLAARPGDGAPMAMLSWVDGAASAKEAAPAAGSAETATK